MEFDIVRFPSAFSKSIGFTLCGIVEDPTSPATTICFKYPLEIYSQQSFDKSKRTLLRFSIVEIMVAISSFNSICEENLDQFKPNDLTNLSDNVCQFIFSSVITCAL